MRNKVTTGIAIALLAVSTACADTTAEVEPTTEPEPVAETSEPAPDPEPYPHTGDAELEGMWDDCAAGDGDACDALYMAAPAGSDAEAFGDTCAGRQEPLSGWCGDKAADEFMTDELFATLVAPMILEQLDGGSCDWIDIVGAEPFIAAFREGFTQSGDFDWKPAYDGILNEIIEENC